MLEIFGGTINVRRQSQGSQDELRGVDPIVTKKLSQILQWVDVEKRGIEVSKVIVHVFCQKGAANQRGEGRQDTDEENR